MSGFTPGPWLVEHRKSGRREGYNTEIFTQDGGSGHGVIATLAWYPKPMDGLGRIGTYREANAALIAAAPELLAALQAVDLARHTDAPADWERATALSDAAIRKATGQSVVQSDNGGGV